MNFNPSGGTTTELPITVDRRLGRATRPICHAVRPAVRDAAAGREHGRRRPRTSTSTSSTRSGNVVAVEHQQQRRDPRAAPGGPTIPAPGNYTVVIKVVSGPDPGHVEFVNVNENVDVIGLAAVRQRPGGTYYPTSLGHDAAAEHHRRRGRSLVGAGAVPRTEPARTPSRSARSARRSSVFNPDGTPQGVAPVLVQTPVVSGPDGGNTSFFPPGADHRHQPTRRSRASRPPPTNLSQNLPSFFGTSSAAPERRGGRRPDDSSPRR